MTEELPAPLVPPDADLRDFPFTPIFRARLFGSSFHARANDSAWRAGVTLWLKSWDQVPAGTLPDDDVDLCRLAELGRDRKAWDKVREAALHGWRKCSDGRLHHAVVAEGVLEAWARRSSAKRKGVAGALARWGASNGTGNAPANATAIAQAMPSDSKGQGQGQGHKPPFHPAGGTPPSGKTNGKARKHAMPTEFCISDRVRTWASEKGVDRLDDHFDAFRRKCQAKGYEYIDWDAAFMEAVREDWAKLRLATGGTPDYSEVIANLKD